MPDASPDLSGELVNNHSIALEVILMARFMF